MSLIIDLDYSEYNCSFSLLDTCNRRPRLMSLSATEAAAASAGPSYIVILIDRCEYAESDIAVAVSV